MSDEVRGPLGHLHSSKYDIWRACELRALLKDEELIEL